MTLTKIIAQDGPRKKFSLIKKWGRALDDHGYKCHEMSCAELEAAIKTINGDSRDMYGDDWSGQS